MKIRVFISALSLLFGITSVCGQVNLSEMEPDSPDSLTKSRILYFSPGRGGRNMVWDFSSKLGSKESSKVMFMKDSTGLVSITERDKIAKLYALAEKLHVKIGGDTNDRP